MMRFTIIVFCLFIMTELGDCRRTGKAKGGNRGGNWWFSGPPGLFRTRNNRVNCNRVKFPETCETCCNTAEAVTANICDSSPCINGATCNPHDGGFTCSCRPGYSGPSCGDQQCITNINGGFIAVNLCDFCENGATCNPTDTSFSCACLPGFIGTLCSVDLCGRNPCQNNGTCRKIADGFTCRCPSGFTGSICDVPTVPAANACDSNPCLNAGTCMRDGGSGFSCTCQSEFSGTLCEVKPIIKSINYPSDYPTNTEQIVQINGTEGKRIKITFDNDFVIQQVICLSSSSSSTNCPFDNLQIGDTKYCGGTPPSPITLPVGQGTTVTFKSNILFNCMGFKLTYEYID